MIKLILNFIFIFYTFQLWADVVINELHYSPTGNGDTTEFVELWNTDNTTIDISDWYFSAGIDYLFENGTTIPANDFLVIAQQLS